MKARDLKKLLQEVPDDTPLLIPGSDHSYQGARCVLTTALMEGRNQWTEDHGEALTPESQYGKRTLVLVVGA